jgi:hypothetical protein
MLSSGRASLDELKRALAQKTGAPESLATTSGPPLATGLIELDALLAGGLPRGRLIEIAGARSSGKATVALGAAARASQAGQLVAWIDGPEELYPPAAAAMGLELARLLIVRPGVPEKGAALAAARAGEILTRSRAFALVVVDLGAHTVMPERAAARLRQAAHDAGIVLVALSARPGAVPHAGLGLTVSSTASGGAIDPRAGDPRAGAVSHFSVGDELARRRFHVTVSRGGAPAHTQISVGTPTLASFRSRDQQLELLATAEAIRPIPKRRMP